MAPSRLILAMGSSKFLINSMCPPESS